MTEKKENVYIVMLTISLIIIVSIWFFAIVAVVNKERKAEEVTTESYRELISKKGFYTGFFGVCHKKDDDTFKVSCIELLSDDQLKEFRSSQSLNRKR